MPLSMNVQPQQLVTFAPILKKLNKKYHTVLADKESEGAEVRSKMEGLVNYSPCHLSIDRDLNRSLPNSSRMDFQELACSMAE